VLKSFDYVGSILIYVLVFKGSQFFVKVDDETYLRIHLLAKLLLMPGYKT